MDLLISANDQILKMMKAFPEELCKKWEEAEFQEFMKQFDGDENDEESL